MLSILTPNMFTLVEGLADLSPGDETHNGIQTAVGMTVSVLWLLGFVLLMMFLFVVVPRFFSSSK